MKFLFSASTPALVLSFLVPAASAQTADYDILLPHLALGGGYSSILRVSDPLGVESRLVRIAFFDDNGSPLPVRIDGSAPSATADLNLSRFEEKRLRLTVDGSSLRTGWLTLICDRGSKLYASLLFMFGEDGLPPADAVGIVPSGVQRTWYVAVDRQDADDLTGVAVANPNSHAVEVEFNFFKGPLRVPGTTAVRRTIPALGHLALFAYQLFPVNFKGIATLEIYGVTGSLAVTALHANGSQYSSLAADPAVELWDFSVGDSAGRTIEKGTWCWKYNESTGFHGVASIDERRINLRGSFEGSRFEMVRFAGKGDAPGAELHVYQGMLDVQGEIATLRGTLLEIDSAGAALRRSTFSARRLP